MEELLLLIFPDRKQQRKIDLLCQTVRFVWNEALREYKRTKRKGDAFHKTAREFTREFPWLRKEDKAFLNQTLVDLDCVLSKTKKVYFKSKEGDQNAPSSGNNLEFTKPNHISIGGVGEMKFEPKGDLGEPSNLIVHKFSLRTSKFGAYYCHLKFTRKNDIKNDEEKVNEVVENDKVNEVVENDKVNEELK